MAKIMVEFAARHNIPRVYRSFAELIADRALDVIDLCTPPNLRAEMIVASMQAGKHVPKALMYDRVPEEMDATRADACSG